MNLEEKILFLEENIEPIPHDGEGRIFRASVYLTDGTFLPCVRFLDPKQITSQAMTRFKERGGWKKLYKQKSPMSYGGYVEHFVTSGNNLNEYDIDRIEISPFALPAAVLVQIKGETTMSWTGFCLKMKDGKIFGFGSRFLFDFFQMPEGYLPTDVASVINHSYITTTGAVGKHKVPFLTWPEDYDKNAVHHERPFFNCYIKGI